MLLEFIKSPDGKLIPIGDESYERVSKMKSNDTVFMEYKPRRNYGNHKRLFSMLKIVFDSQNHYKDIDNILEICKFRAGYFDTIITHNGKKHYKTRSIAFYNMDEEEFKNFFSKCIDTCLEIVPMGKQELEEQILRFC